LASAKQIKASWFENENVSCLYPRQLALKMIIGSMKHVFLVKFLFGQTIKFAFPKYVCVLCLVVQLAYLWIVSHSITQFNKIDKRPPDNIAKHVKTKVFILCKLILWDIVSKPYFLKVCKPGNCLTWYLRKISPDTHAIYIYIYIYIYISLKVHPAFVLLFYLAQCRHSMD
jgi:hypothetical protein